jgi:hypothetical protein
MGVFREAIISFLAAITKQERVRFSERIKVRQDRSNKAPGRLALADDVGEGLRHLRERESALRRFRWCQWRLCTSTSWKLKIGRF